MSTAYNRCQFYYPEYRHGHETMTKVRYQPVLHLPRLLYEQFMALRDNIAINGVNQNGVLLTPSEKTSARHGSDVLDRSGRNGKHYRNSTIAGAADERGGTTPFNCLPIPTGGRSPGSEGHPAATPYDLAVWRCRYILPPGGVLCDPFCGSGTMLVAGLGQGASRVIGIDKEARYLRIAGRRIEES
jgi:DNA modification methylase